MRKNNQQEPPLSVALILKQLLSLANHDVASGMIRFGIAGKVLGVSIPQIRKLAKEIGKDSQIASELWDSGVHEARILASLVAVPSEVTEKQMDTWVADFDSWDVCDQVCGNLFDKTPYAFDKAKEWTEDEQEFVKRAGFVLMAELAVHDKKSPDAAFLEFFPFIRKGSIDERNFVKKAVNWALRQIGKRNKKTLLPKAIVLAEELAKNNDSRASRWIGKDALRELRAHL